MSATEKPSLSAKEARELHSEALVIDAQQPPATSGFLFTKNMKTALKEYASEGLSRREASVRLADMAVRELQTSSDARKQYLDLWRRSGVTVAGTTCASAGPFTEAFEKAVKRVADARGIVDALEGELRLIRCSDDIEQTHRDGKHGIIIDFQDSIAFGTDLNRIDLFYNLGLRVVQLTYNLRNLVGDGCTETHKSGLTYFGREVVQRLNELNMAVDVSHCSEQVGWDTIEVSTSPVIITHSSSAAVCYHDRGKSDSLARAIAKQGGFFGVVVIPGFLQETTEATLEDFANHVEHLVNIMGIDHVGVGNDKAGPGPGTESLVVYPETMPEKLGDGFNWSGFREKEHRVTKEHHLVGYDNFGDWPNLTIKLAERGFTELELRKLLGLNFLRVFREIVG